MSKKEILAKGKYLALIKHDQYEYVERVLGTGIAIVFAITDSKEIILVEQYRKAVDARCIELPAGIINDTGSKESTLAGAKRELLEETGYEAEKINFMGCFPVSVGITSGLYNIFIASGLRKTGPGGGDATENITVHNVPFEELSDFIRKKSFEGFHIDLKIFAVSYMYDRKLEALTKNIQP